MMTDIRGSIDAYLDAVDAALLKSGLLRSQRTGIVRDLELHIEEGLRELAQGREVAPEDVRAVLGGLGSPETYGLNAAGAGGERAPAEKPGVRRKLPATLLWGAVLAGVGFVGLLLL